MSIFNIILSEKYHNRKFTAAQMRIKHFLVRLIETLLLAPPDSQFNMMATHNKRASESRAEL